MWWIDVLAIAGLALLWGAVAWMARGCEKLQAARGARGAAAPAAPASGDASLQAPGRRS